MKQIFSLGFLLALFTCSAFAQSEAQLQQAFEGKTVLVKIDMPATHQGIDLYPERNRPTDFDAYSKRLKNFGISIRNGDTAMITKVRLKDKNIEFQLGGGGYGTAGDETDTGTNFTSAPKSRREKDLEEALKQETDSRRRKELQDDLNYERRQREREDNRNRAIAEDAAEAKRERIARKRLEGGSRFNIWFEQKIQPASITPAAVMEILSEYVEFSGRASNRPEDTRPTAALFNPEVLLRLRKGLTRNDVEALLGRPMRVSEKGDASNRIIVWYYQVEDRDVQIELFEDVLVRYAITSR
ncbi:MAG: hypothetical protein JST84_27725 [Acidobacteria bacterium]|nr:hypothetical protein [Acidobacteriota bacterium]MBS1811983.1 hypothetical protein [Acidobacteriota bacterium]